MKNIWLGIFAISLLVATVTSCDDPMLHPQYEYVGPQVSSLACPSTATLSDTGYVDLEDLTPEQIKAQTNLVKSLIRQEIFDQIVTAGYLKYTTTTMPNGQLRITGALTIVTGP